MQGTFQPLTVIMGDKRISEEKEFLEALCQRKGDSIFQNTPIKRRRSGDHCAAAGINYNGEYQMVSVIAKRHYSM